MRVRFWVLMAVLAAFVAGAPAQAPQESQVDSSFIYCSIQDNVHSVVYVSGIFMGDAAHKFSYQDRFKTQLKRLNPRLYGEAMCSFRETRALAEGAKRSHLMHLRVRYKHVIETGWIG